MKKVIETLLLLGASLLLAGCGFVKSSNNQVIEATIKKIIKEYPEDNFVEEWVEDKIENVTGLKTDLSPSSPEVK